MFQWAEDFPRKINSGHTPSNSVSCVLWAVYLTMGISLQLSVTELLLDVDKCRSDFMLRVFYVTGKTPNFYFTTNSAEKHHDISYVHNTNSD
jgi:hypothetical protein